MSPSPSPKKTPEKSGATAASKRSVRGTRTLVKKRPPAAASAGEANDGGQSVSGGRESARQVEQLALLALALGFGLVGFLVHLFWIVSVVLMSVLLGLIAANLRTSRSRGGVISDVVSEVRGIADDVTSDQ